MTDSIIERQAIRAALALAAASAHGQVADAIADMRDEASQLMGMFMKSTAAPDDVRRWCDDASSLVERFSADGYLPSRAALHASAAILRLRLAVARVPVASPARAAPSVSHEVKKRPAPAAKPIVAVDGKLKIVFDVIAAHPDIRTKDLVGQLKNTLSPRTVKRCLKELCDSHVVKRTEQEDRSVEYRVDTRS